MDENQKQQYDFEIKQFIKLGNNFGYSEIVNNTFKSMKQIDENYERTKMEHENWEGFSRPRRVVDIESIKEEIRNMKSGEEKRFEIHHPFYRKKIHEFCEYLGFKHKSSVNRKIDMEDDSTLVKHFNCGRLTPKNEISWYDDLNSWGGYFQSQANCKHCDGKFLSDYFYPDVESEKDRKFGYMYLRGKNTITVKAPCKSYVLHDKNKSDGSENVFERFNPKCFYSFCKKSNEKKTKLSKDSEINIDYLYKVFNNFSMDDMKTLEFQKESNFTSQDFLIKSPKVPKVRKPFNLTREYIERVDSATPLKVTVHENYFLLPFTNTNILRDTLGIVKQYIKKGNSNLKCIKLTEDTCSDVVTYNKKQKDNICNSVISRQRIVSAQEDDKDKCGSIKQYVGNDGCYDSFFECAKHAPERLNFVKCESNRIIESTKESEELTEAKLPCATEQNSKVTMTYYHGDLSSSMLLNKLSNNFAGSNNPSKSH